MTKKGRKLILIGENYEDVQLFGSDCLVAQIADNGDSDLQLLTDRHALKEFMRQSIVDGFLLIEDGKKSQSKIPTYLKDTGRPLYVLSHPGEQLGSYQSGLIFNKAIKRLFDVLIALSGLVVTGLVSLIIYPIVQKQAPGPLIFKQERVGYNGRRFTMYKFRSMYVGADRQKKELLSSNELSDDYMFKMDQDPRVFPLGQKIRNWSIDELPQFINVLKGEMSFIGTRPPTVDEVQRYELHHFKRLACKPGITGMWQVSGRSNIQDFEDVVALDASYIDNWSLWLDVKIFWKTIAVVLKREGSK